MPACDTCPGACLPCLQGSGSLFRGFTAVAVGAGPAHALYFAAYEQSKFCLGISGNPAAHPYATAGAAAVAAFAHEATMNPIEVIKQRMQMHGSGAAYRTPWDCARKVLASEGLIAFYRSFPTQVRRATCPERPANGLHPPPPARPPARPPNGH